MNRIAYALKMIMPQLNKTTDINSIPKILNSFHYNENINYNEDNTNEIFGKLDLKKIESPYHAKHEFFNNKNIGGYLIEWEPQFLTNIHYHNGICCFKPLETGLIEHRFELRDFSYNHKLTYCSPDKVYNIDDLMGPHAIYNDNNYIVSSLHFYSLTGNEEKN
jgi:hypothetical protein